MVSSSCRSGHSGGQCRELPSGLGLGRVDRVPRAILIARKISTSTDFPPLPALLEVWGLALFPGPTISSSAQIIINYYNYYYIFIYLMTDGFPG